MMDYEELTWREQEVLALLAERSTNREIAAQLHLAESTVKDYVSNILGKLTVKNRREAVNRAKELGLLEAGRKRAFEPRTNLPAETTPFIGRQRELNEIRAAFAKTRLLTLTGPGGIGKTRLALKTAAEVAEDFEGGSFFVPLAPLHSIDDIIQTIAEELKCPLATNEAPRRQLLRYLRPKQILLVMDNYEHLLEGAGIVSEILQAAPAVKILATSREKLNLQSETVLNIGGLTFPAPVESDALLDHAALQEHDAIQLFVQNARKVRLPFDPSLEELGKIAKICQMVQGMPLAIELAAAWLHILSLAEISEELQKSFDILSSEKRDVPARHRSLRAVFDHTWSLLNHKEREIVMRLSLFRGGFTRDAALKVASASVPLLGALVSKSVLGYEPSSGRFEIHELLRQYVQQRLQLRPEDTLAAREAYASYFAEFMNLNWEDLQGSKQLQAIGELEADIENIRSAWRFHIEKADASQLAKYVNSFWFLYWIRGWNHAAEELFGKLVHVLSDLDGDAEIEVLLAIAKANQGFFMTWLGLADQGYALAKASVEALERFGHSEGLLFAYNSLTLAAYYLEHAHVEKEAAERLLEVARASGDAWSTSFALSLFGMASLRVEAHGDAKDAAEESLQMSESMGDLFLPFLSLSTLGYLAILDGELAIARAHYTRVLRAAEALGFRMAIGNSIKYLGQIALREGATGEAETYFQQSLQIAYELGLSRDIVNHLFEFARVRLAQNRAAEAAGLLNLLLQQPVSQQARLEGGRIRDNAQQLVARLEKELSSEAFATAQEQGRRLALDDKLAELLNPKQSK
jgi:predicted ATPase/DNA-binding CsgD family transcriptional regulator